MKGNPPAAGGPLTSKPTWSNTPRGVWSRRFFLLHAAPAHAARAFQQAADRHASKAVTVGLSEDTLPVTLHEALSASESNNHAKVNDQCLGVERKRRP